MLKLILAIITGLVGAALLHLVIILALPYFSDRDAYTKVVAQGEAYRFHVIGNRPDNKGLVKDDPFLDVAVCSFDLTERPVRLTTHNGVPFWSLATFDAASNETFSINDRTAAASGLDVIIANPIQATALRKTMPASLMQSILVETRQMQGYAVLRVMAPQASYKPAAAAFLKDATCTPVAWK
ncbi:DUF1254 domain-containing protein [Rhizobium oryzicola]|uniref:DUF1254 domain-containing protein n=1 Tax=Rhizobium oryzicola TaxID=1232668 RepID=A0ABT8SSY0_9HYPH|nr:DUF1254 domain-containing protein [Rhizobium oryzicola]MDO1581515.1 DUF1254 domain-containing protein [Rhizobium oryzicola]